MQKYHYFIIQILQSSHQTRHAFYEYFVNISVFSIFLKITLAFSKKVLYNECNNK